ncbi:MAG TPA: hypothetical protein VM598_01820, partial [Bdellovibrionota bacterium]|nr:hypothetical protein [Bdellovibrionota bacterium]
MSHGIKLFMLLAAGAGFALALSAQAQVRSSPIHSMSPVGEGEVAFPGAATKSKVIRFELRGTFASLPKEPIRCEPSTPRHFAYQAENGVIPIDIEIPARPMKCLVRVTSAIGETHSKEFNLDGAELAADDDSANSAVNAVLVSATAKSKVPTDKEGKPLPWYGPEHRRVDGLTAQNIRVRIGGQDVPRESVTDFSQDPMKATIGILIDASASMRPDPNGGDGGNMSKLERARRAALALVRKLDPKLENVFVMHFNNVFMVNDDPQTEDSTRPIDANLRTTFAFKDDPRLPYWIWRKAAKPGVAFDPSRVSDTSVRITNDPDWQYAESQLFKAIEHAIGLMKQGSSEDNAARNQIQKEISDPAALIARLRKYTDESEIARPKKVLFIFTDGADMYGERDKAISLAVSNSVQINVVGLFRDDDPNQAVGKQIIQALASKTGGRAYLDVRNSDDVSRLAEAWVEESHKQYHFTVMTDPKLRRGCHQIQIVGYDERVLYEPYQRQLAEPNQKDSYVEGRSPGYL